MEVGIARKLRDVPPEFDIRRIRPDHLPRGERFETLEDSEDLRDAYLAAFSKSLPSAAEELRGCRHASCNRPFCPICTRFQRILWFSEVMPLVASLEGDLQFTTICLLECDPGELPGIDLKQSQNTLRTRLRRSGFDQAVLIGGTEAGWIASRNRWILHVHAIVQNGIPAAWARLRKYYDGQKDVDQRELRDAAALVSYLLKFATYHRPGSSGAKRARAYPLPNARLIELAAWWQNYTIDDFTFLFGARRRAGRICIER